jgi:uncharacterized protein
VPDTVAGTVIVIAKTPVAGRVKTRLTPPLTPSQATDVAWACLTDTLAAVERGASQRRVLLLDGEPGTWVPHGFDVVPQRGDGLADRLTAGFADVDDDAIVIAMDTPQVDSASLAAALRALQNSHDTVFGPATDGGFWLLGLRRAIDPAAVFDGIPMSTPHTGAAQLERLRGLGLSTLVLERLRDVDTIDDVLGVAAAHPESRLGRLVSAIGLPTSG